MENGEKVQQQAIAPGSMSDAILRKTIAVWRLLLAQDIAGHTSAIEERELTTAADRAIECCLFLRLCENRAILPPGTLAELSVGAEISARLTATFRQITVGGVPGDPSMLPQISDEPLRAILATLNSPQHPCQFSTLPLDTLGQAHEYCLARPIQRSSAGRVRASDKGTTRKASGVYYTPAAIVDYLVRATLGGLLAGVSPVQAAERTILDPACGSGAFLLGAYQFLLAWYRDQYLSAGAQRHPDELCQATSGEWQLTYAERRRILLRHIYGVDSDARAVEVCGLTLLLALLEGAPIEANAPPSIDLSQNLRCGDALIGPDIRDHPAASEPENEALAALSPFDWQAAFPAILARGGFDAVIGNPPYLSYSGRQAVTLPEPVRHYLFDRYASAGWPAAHTFFIAQAVRHLARRRVAFVVPDQIGHLAGYAPTRALLTRQTRLVEVRYWGEEVFAEAITPTLTFIADRAFTGPTTIYERNATKSTATFASDHPWQSSSQTDLLAKIWHNSESLGKLVADPGVHTGNCAGHLIIPLADAPTDAIPILEGKQVGRYRCDPPTKALRLDYAPADDEYFTIRPEVRYTDAPFVIRQTAPYPIVGPRRHATYFRNSLLALYTPDDGRAIEYLVGLLNSTLMRYVYMAKVREARQRAFPQVKIGALRALPIRRLDLANPVDREQHDQIVAGVREMLALQQNRLTTDDPKNKASVQGTIARLDHSLDRLVYKLYGLDRTQIAAIEAATQERTP